MGNSASALPYSIGKQVSVVNNGIWALHEGTQKSDGGAVSVFSAKKPALAKTAVDKSKDPSVMQIGPALHHFVNCKKLRHPHILKVLATLDTDHPTSDTNNSVTAAAAAASKETGEFIIVTEKCMPLDVWLQSGGDDVAPEVLAWGLESIVRALSFLHNSAHLFHGTVSPDSFMVTPAGDVKLWNFSLVGQIETSSGANSLPRPFLDWEALLTPQPYRSPERQEGRWDVLANSPVHLMDSYSVGVMVEHLFGGNIPQPLIKAVQRMQTPNLKMRPRLQPLLKCPIFDTPYQKLQLQLEEFNVQPVEQKISFWQTIPPQMTVGLIHPNVAKFRLLPLIQTSAKTIGQSETLRSQDMYRRELAAMMPPLFYIAEHYLTNADDFRREIRPLAALLFTVPDRGIRAAFLQKVSLFVQFFEKNDLNNIVFEPACSGFSDSSVAMRELTLKSTMSLVPHLTHPNLEKLSRYFVRLQSDPEPTIRTSTIVFFSQLAPHLTEMSRHKQLLPAFTRAMKDTFPACRLAAMQSVRQVKDLFAPHELASTVIPAVAPHLLDGVLEVRTEAFLVFDDFVWTLRKESDRMATMTTGPPENQQTTFASASAAAAAPTAAAAATSSTKNNQTQQTTASPASGGGGYLSGLSSWMSSTTSASPAAAAAAPVPVPNTAMNTTTPTNTAMASLSIAAATTTNTAGASYATDDLGDMNDDADGWGDEDDDMDNFEPVSSSSSSAAAPMSAPAPPLAKPFTAPIAVAAAPRAISGSAAANNTEDDFFGGFSGAGSVKKPMVKPVVRPPAAKGKLVVPKKTTATTTTMMAAAPKPAVKKLVVEDDTDGWDDF